MRKSKTLHMFIPALLLLGGTAFTFVGVNTIFLPGTQPGVVQTFETPTLCQSCHQTGFTGHEVTITNDWKGSMMAHSARDPVFYAAVAVANKYESGTGELCIRCHAPTGWLEGRSNPPTGQGLTGNDLNSVQCDFCHRMKDPLLPDSTVNPPVPGYGNAMMIMQTPRYPKRGPYFDAVPTHQVAGDSFQRSGNMCGVCHNVSNPAYATNPVTQSPHEYSPEQRTLSEWQLSWYAMQGEAGTCQACHMSPDSGYGANTSMTPLRPDIPKHDLTGGNTFVPDILPDFWASGIDTTLLAQGKQRAISMLSSAAMLVAVAYRTDDTTLANITITNLTGHKLPTGYPEGRRLWLNIVGRNAQGDTLFQSGAYDFSTADLITDPQLKLYQVRFGLTAARAAQYGLPPGPSFHLALNDTLFFDNRIPPRGFSNAAFSTHLAQPVGYSYADGQYWDNTTYGLPTGVTEVSATLYYQTASKEYITFLRDENIGNPNDWRAWGDSLYSSWSRHGKSRPVAMQSVTVQVADSTTGLRPPQEELPASITLRQNYPNPFNPSTTIEFSIDRTAFVSLRVYDIAGREVTTLFSGRVAAGQHRATLNATELPSGVYMYRLTTGGNSVTKKLILIR